jgi:3-oxoacyl-[acyl-carrier protein] reductase
VQTGLEGKVALVTGASRGIGRATALALAGEGADVSINYLQTRRGAEEVARRIRKMGRRAITARANVGSRAEVRGMVEETVASLGRIDILVNNAGIMRRLDVMNMNQRDLDELIDVNMKGTIYCSLDAARHMIKHKGGRIINLSSVLAQGAWGKNSTLYSMTKGAIITLTKRLAQELGPYGITVNAVAPGFIRTDMTVEGDLGEFRRRVRETAPRTALRRIGEPEEVANVILFLASDGASFITGQTIMVDGGRGDLLSSSA